MMLKFIFFLISIILISFSFECMAANKLWKATEECGTNLLEPDTRTLDEIYQAALIEMNDGPLIVYAGGDAKRQSDYHKIGFEGRFPGIKMEMIVDLSKEHNKRIDNQLKTNSVVFDVTHLQTFHDFPRWKSEGVLLPYKGMNWNRIYGDAKDLEGYYTGILIYAFSNFICTDNIPSRDELPTEAEDYLKSELKHKLIMTYPNDDDAVLFLFKQIVDQYGLEYIQKLKSQNVTWVRGTQTPRDLVASCEFTATMTTGGSLTPTPGLTTFILPKEDPFVIWPQTAAIFKNTSHPETAKLYISWMTSYEKQNTKSSYSVRDDVLPPNGYNSIWRNPNGHPMAFHKFLMDQNQVEDFKTKVTQIIGEPQGPNPADINGELGTHPIKALP